MQMSSKVLAKKIASILEDLKAIDIQVIDVKKHTSITDFMIIVSGRSTRQVKAIADKFIEVAKDLNVSILGVEGEQHAEWILMDLGDVITHVMHPTSRAYYQLEKLWTTDIQEVESS